MTVYTEIEVRCDGIEMYGCEPAFYAHTAAKARQEARSVGWLVSQPGGKDYCPDHRHLAGKRP